MSDSERTPQGTARINSERFETELEAVWYAANYYYEASYRRMREYGGVVFREGEKFGITVRIGMASRAGVASGIRITPDVPPRTMAKAIWHTHLPASMSGDTPGLNALYARLLKELTGEILEHQYSPDDQNTQAAWTRDFGRVIPIYLVTANIIERYVGPGPIRGVWAKDPPSRMRNIEGLP